MTGRAADLGCDGEQLRACDGRAATERVADFGSDGVGRAADLCSDGEGREPWRRRRAAATGRAVPVDLCCYGEGGDLGSDGQRQGL